MKLGRLLLSLLGCGTTFAQDVEIPRLPFYSVNNRCVADSTSILMAFKQGTSEGSLRYFFMATDNTSGLTDYVANAFGGGVKFETAVYRRLQLGASGYSSFNIGSSDLTTPDPVTGQISRYELALFDITQPSKHGDLTRLEELYLNYHWKEGSLRFGRTLINTPFINQQDGRMRPTAVQGLLLDTKIGRKNSLQAALINKLSPRSTTNWYSIGESIGIYAQGISTDGSKANYAHHLNTPLLATVGITSSPFSQMRIRFFNLYAANLFNAAFLQLNFDKTLNSRNQLHFALQSIREDAVKYGGNQDQSMTYIDQDSHCMTFGAKVELNHQKSTFSLNYNRITTAGRYLIPREWGQEPFFTYISRERNEGAGNVHAIVAKYSRKFTKKQLKLLIAAGYFQLPDVKDVRLNKYGLPSYAQANIDLRYTFQGNLDGLEARLLVVGKLDTGKYYDNLKYLQNKTNVVLYNLVLNYHF